MKSTLIILSTILLTTLLSSFTSKNEIEKCYILFKSATKLTASDPDRLPESADNFRVVKTESGEVKISRKDGYRILYNNDKQVPFVNMKVELSKIHSYKKDQINLLENLKYLNSHSEDMESKDIIELEFNGFKVYGFSRGSIEFGSFLGTFIMFPGNGIVVYFYFCNMKPEFRNFENLEDYKKQRDRFMDKYTKYLTTCKDK